MSRRYLNSNLSRQEWAILTVGVTLTLICTYFYIHPNVEAEELARFVSPIPVEGTAKAESLASGFSALLTPTPLLAMSTPTPTPAPAQDCDTERCEIFAYLREKFGARGDDAIKMIRECENGSFDPRRVSRLNVQENGRRSYDVGVMQINVDEHNTVEMEKLKDFRYNIDRGYEKYKAKNNTFYLWTCGHVVGDYTYVDYLKGKKK